MSRQALDVQAYYREVTSADLLGVARELIGERITQETQTVVYCNCPNHTSVSERSLQLSVHQGLFTCWGCGVSGDVLQFVEFIQTGKVTHGIRGPMPQGHKDARDWLAAKVGLPPLAQAGLTDEERAAAHARMVEAEDTYDALTELTQHYHDQLLENADALAWLRSKYGITDASIAQLKIGFANDPHAFDTVAARCRSSRSLGATGAFNFDGNDHAHPFFVGRIVFPYWSRGRVVYMIGRATPWTPDTTFEQAKYKKLPVRNERSRANVSRAIDNRALFGEDVLATKPARVLVVEGVPEQIVAMQLGFAAVALTSSGLADEDLARIAKKMRGVGTVYMLQDTELSGVGIASAIKTARALDAEGVACLVATIPPGAAQVAASASLALLVGQDAIDATAALQPSKRAAAIRAAAGEDNAERVAALLAATKLDIADWVVAGAGQGDVEAALAAARQAIDVAIDLAPKIEDPAAQATAIEPILAEVAAMRPAERDRLYKLLKARTGLSVAVLKGEAREAAKAAREKSKKGGGSKPLAITDADAGSCREVVIRALLDAKDAQEAPNWSEVAESIYAWLEENGAHFFRDRTGRPVLFWESEVWSMASDATGPKKRYEGLMYRLTGMVPTTLGARTLFCTLSALVADRGVVRDEFSWIHTDFDTNAIFFTLSNERREIARVSPDGVEVLPNGANGHGVILRGDGKLQPIDFVEDADANEVDTLLERLIGQYASCEAWAVQSILDWIACFPLIQFVGTRPTVRLEGPASSGKTWIGKMITMFVYGAEEQKKSTDAANYSDAARNPLVALDNVETSNATSALLDFILTAVTGITREKRSRDTDSGTVSETSTCLVLSTGIEPLGGQFEEILSRSLVIPIDKAQQKDALLEKQLLSQIREERNRIMSALLRRTAIVLALIRDGGHERAMKTIRNAVADHPKSRCDEFFALMYLQRVAAAPEGERERMLARLDDGYVRLIKELNIASDCIRGEADRCVTALDGLFTAIREGGLQGAGWHGLDVNEGKTVIRWARPTPLFNALRSVSKNWGVPFEFKNPAQFGRRLTAAIGILATNGISVEVVQDRHTKANVYTIEDRRGRGVEIVQRTETGNAQTHGADPGEVPNGIPCVDFREDHLEGDRW